MRRPLRAMHHVAVWEAVSAAAAAAIVLSSATGIVLRCVIRYSEEHALLQVSTTEFKRDSIQTCYSLVPTQKGISTDFYI